MPIGEEFPAVLEAARTGDEPAVARLFHDVHPTLLRWLRALEPRAAEDVAAQTWLAVAERLGRFTGDEGAFRGWLFSVARRRLADHRRRAVREASRRSSLGYAGQPSGDDPADEVVVRCEAERAVALVRSVLPGEQAEVVLLRTLGGLTAAEVGRVVGRSPGAVRVLQHRALRRLAEALDRQGAVT
ncbi:MAG: sigma-70 family RNA polymerase sigma factor [Acidimicrobiia bacterium]|nr:sigma-70 family RNA polymerase sigma factor [Acidimicrobiia bacterium]